MSELITSLFAFLTEKTTLDVLGAILGLIYLWQEMKATAWMWVTGSVMPLIYIIVLYQAGLYADCAMEIYYFLAGIYGLVYWLFGKTKDGTLVEITYTPRKIYSLLICTFLVIFLGIRALLIEFTDSNVPTLDAITTALSVIGLWMLSRKYIEQWWVWFVVDAISAALYIYKGVYARACLYSLYTIFAVIGYLKWKRTLKEKSNTLP